MEKYLVDSNVVILYLRDNPKAVSFLDSLGRFRISSIVAGEVYQGVKNKTELRKTSDFFSKYCYIVPIDVRISELALDLLQKHVLSRGLLIMDALIAATTIEKDLYLVTVNAKHFRFIKRLKLVDWRDV